MSPRPQGPRPQAPEGPHPRAPIPGLLPSCCAYVLFSQVLPSFCGRVPFLHRSSGERGPVRHVLGPERPCWGCPGASLGANICAFRDPGVRHSGLKQETPSPISHDTERLNAHMPIASPGRGCWDRVYPLLHQETTQTSISRYCLG